MSDSGRHRSSSWEQHTESHQQQQQFSRLWGVVCWVVSLGVIAMCTLIVFGVIPVWRLFV